MVVHSGTARLLFLGKGARPDIQTVVAFLCTRVKVVDNDDYKKIFKGDGLSLSYIVYAIDTGYR